jgi:membrane protein DedA with SNARE-associated domain
MQQVQLWPSICFPYTNDMGEFVEQVVKWASDIIVLLGYPGVALLEALESFFPPIPSEIVLPLSGSLVASGRFDFIIVLLVSTVGSIAGIGALYGMARWLGAERVENWLDRYGKWVLLSRSDLKRAQKWFDRNGAVAVLIARLIPGGRSLISVPAGVAGMPAWQFFLFTTLGSGIWNFVLIGAGFLLGQNWRMVETTLSPLSPLIYGVIAVATVYIVGKRLWSRFGPGNQQPQEPDSVTSKSESRQENSPWFSSKRR